ncbi:hypothetical protein [Fangia hongkongensis]|uniref:hypothetical protein n=1 Tax=Fangia hongkongensis TaxID=270495 RepID=UPI0003811C95|nr:hypothetical protein [Fangia hongkongensis]MBK2124753.1 hypothetical protein [Fangia hongkongensis]
MQVINKPLLRTAVLNTKREILLIDAYGENTSEHDPYKHYAKHVSEVPYANALTQDQLTVIDDLILSKKIQSVKINGIITLNTGRTYYREIDRRAIVNTNQEVIGLRFSSKVAPEIPYLPLFFKHEAIDEYARQIGLSLSQFKVLMYRVYFPKMSVDDIAKHAEISTNSVYRYSSLSKEILDIPGFSGAYVATILDDLGVFEIFADYLTSCYVRQDDYAFLQESDAVNLPLKRLLRVF